MVYSARMFWVLQFPDISAHVSSILHMAGGNDIMSRHIPRDNMTLVCSGKNHKSEALHKNIYPETGIMKKKQNFWLAQKQTHWSMESN